MAQPFQLINHKVHGVLDLLVDVSLAAVAVWAWSSGASPAAIAIPGLIGAANLIYSAVTQYALGQRHLISFTLHLVLDAVAGIALVVGAVVLQEDPLYRGVILAMGLGIIGAVILTNPATD